MLLLAVPIVASLVVGLIVPYSAGHGGPDPATEHGLGGESGTMRELPGAVGAAVASLASGASLGPEGPLVGILGTLGAAAGRALKLPPEAGRVLGSPACRRWWAASSATRWRSGCSSSR